VQPTNTGPSSISLPLAVRPIVYSTSIGSETIGRSRLLTVWPVVLHSQNTDSLPSEPGPGPNGLIPGPRSSPCFSSLPSFGRLTGSNREALGRFVFYSRDILPGEALSPLLSLTIQSLVHSQGYSVASVWPDVACSSLDLPPHLSRRSPAGIDPVLQKVPSVQVHGTSRMKLDPNLKSSYVEGCGKTHARFERKTRSTCSIPIIGFGSARKP